MPALPTPRPRPRDRKSTRLNSSHLRISYAVFCLEKKEAAGYADSGRGSHRPADPHPRAARDAARAGVHCRLTLVLGLRHCEYSFLFFFKEGGPPRIPPFSPPRPLPV